uniref:Small heat shock protein 20.3 n=1 Tax=Hyphantria cunea TaxID=39466 RepID=A0A7T3QMK3_HYPCU|nr:small heat shock protein 20.3 [Hyphantria cunea]
MTMYPFFYGFERPRQRRLQDQHFGLGLTPQDYLTVIAVPQANQDYYRPWRNLLAAAQDVGSTIKEDRDKFQVNLDVQHFAPEEISVKTVDGYLVIEAKHEEKQDEHGFISRSFTRRYALPEGVDADTVVSKLSSDGVLSITAPLKPPPKQSNERVVPIVHTGPVKKQVEDKTEQEKE